MGSNHVFIIGRDTDTRLLVPMRVKKHAAKQTYGVEVTYSTREECEEAIIQDQVFEYQTRAMGKVLVTPEHIRKHCICLCSSEDDLREFDRVLVQREGLSKSDFKLKLDMGDLFVKAFNNYFWICDCGTDELWEFEKKFPDAKQ